MKILKEYPFISVVIPTYNRGKLLPLTLDSLLAQTYPQDRFEIVVANNNSTDNTVHILTEYAKQNRNLTFFTENRQGVHYARNSAAHRTRGEILYYTDDDMIASPEMLAELAGIFGEHPEVGAATGKVLPKWEIAPPEWVRQYLQNGWLSLNDLGDVSFVDKQDMGVYSCHQAVRRDVFFQSGGFNPENTAGVWIGDGETGLNIKIKQLGYSFAYVGSAITYHIIPPQRMTQTYLNKRIGNQGNCDAYTEYRKEGMKSMPKRLLSQCASLLSISAKLPIHAVRRPRSFSVRRELAAVYYFFYKIKYNIILIFSKKRRELVERYDWLNE